MLAPLYLLINPVWGFVWAVGLWLVAALGMAYRVLQREGLSSKTSALFPLSLMLTSFPIARLVHQGNVELLVWVLVVAGTVGFLNRNDQTAAVLWGLAGAVKLYPAILLMLLVPRRKLGALLIGVGTGIVVTCMSLWWLGPTFTTAWKGSLHNVCGYQEMRASEWSLRELAANHSWFGWVKLISVLTHIPSEKLLVPYLACGAALFAWAMKRIWCMPSANQLLAVNTFMVAFPAVSYYHTLVHLYAPLLVLVCVTIRDERNRVSLRHLQGAFLLFLPLSLPYTLLLYPKILVFCGLVQSVALLLLFLRATDSPFGALGHRPAH